jgi:hypothetical protein
MYRVLKGRELRAVSDALKRREGGGSRGTTTKEGVDSRMRSGLKKGFWET